MKTPTNNKKAQYLLPVEIRNYGEIWTRGYSYISTSDNRVDTWV